MDMYAVRTLRSQPLRLALTVGGIALCIVLMLFLLAVYRGVADGSVEYIRQNRADLWVLQDNATNILRGSSLFSADQINAIAQAPGVRTAAPVLFLLSTIRKGDKVGTVFLTGFEPEKGLGGPPQLVRGRSPRADDEIVLDRSFALKFGFEMRGRGRSAGTPAEDRRHQPRDERLRHPICLRDAPVRPGAHRRPRIGHLRPGERGTRGRDRTHPGGGL